MGHGGVGRDQEEEREVKILLGCKNKEIFKKVPLMRQTSNNINRIDNLAEYNKLCQHLKDLQN